MITEREFVGPPLFDPPPAAPLSRAEVEQMAIDAVSAAHLNERMLEEKLTARIDTEHDFFVRGERMIVNGGTGIVLVMLIWLVVLTTRR